MLQFIIFNNSTIQFNSIHWQYFLQILPKKPIVRVMPVNNVNTSYINVCRSSDKQDQSQMYMFTQLLISTQFTCWFLKCNWFAPQLNKTFSICYNSTVLVHCVQRTNMQPDLYKGENGTTSNVFAPLFLYAEGTLHLSRINSNIVNKVWH